MSYQLHPDKLNTVAEVVRYGRSLDQERQAQQKKQVRQQQSLIKASADTTAKLAQQLFLERRLKLRGLL